MSLKTFTEAVHAIGDAGSDGITVDQLADTLFVRRDEIMPYVERAARVHLVRQVDDRLYATPALYRVADNGEGDEWDAAGYETFLKIIRDAGLVGIEQNALYAELERVGLIPGPRGVIARWRTTAIEAGLVGPMGSSPDARIVWLEHLHGEPPPDPGGTGTLAAYRAAQRAHGRPGDPLDDETGERVEAFIVVTVTVNGNTVKAETALDTDPDGFEVIAAAVQGTAEKVVDDLAAARRREHHARAGEHLSAG